MEMSDAVFRSGGEHLHLAVSEIPDKLHLYPILTLQGYLGCFNPQYATSWYTFMYNPNVILEVKMFVS